MSNSHAERTRVRFNVQFEIELDDGIVLAPGIYEGRTTHLGYIKHEEYTWTPKMHFLELDAHQSADMGGKAPEHDTLIEYDITKYVKNGLICVK
jgi:hypothetical protein